MAEVESSARTSPETESNFRPRIRLGVESNRAGASSPEPNCAICLGQLKNVSYTDKCLHRFCFACIQEWSKIKQECPLCKQNFSSIIHNVRSENDYDQCRVEAQPQPHREQSLIDAWNHLVAAYRQGMERRRSGMDREFDMVTYTNRSMLGEPLYIPLHERRNPRFRVRVYREMLYSAALRNRTGIPRESSPEFYRSNPAELSRLVAFFRREFNALLNSSTSVFDAIRSVTTELQISSIRSPAFHNLIRYYLGNNRAFIFRHELYNFAVSGYDVVGYDRYVKYYPHGFVGPPTRNNINLNYLPEIMQGPETFEEVQEVLDVQEVQVVHDIQEIADEEIETVQDFRDIQASPRDVFTISDDNEGSDDCEIINVIRPEDRVAEIIYLSSDDDVIQISESSSSSSSSESTDDEESANNEVKNAMEVGEENKSEIPLLFNLPSTSQQNNDTPAQSYTPPLVLDLSMNSTIDHRLNFDSENNSNAAMNDQSNCDVKYSVLTLKRSHSSSSDKDSNSSKETTPIITRRKKRRDMRRRATTKIESSSSDDESSDSSRCEFNRIDDCS